MFCAVLNVYIMSVYWHIDNYTPLYKQPDQGRISPHFIPSQWVSVCNGCRVSQQSATKTIIIYWCQRHFDWPMREIYMGLRFTGRVDFFFLLESIYSWMSGLVSVVWFCPRFLQNVRNTYLCSTSTNIRTTCKCIYLFLIQIVKLLRR